ncbi:MAG TPA: extracellular solute-binding protein [Thermodesulfobacteriota bacterium]
MRRKQQENQTTGTRGATRREALRGAGLALAGLAAGAPGRAFGAPAVKRKVKIVYWSPLDHSQPNPRSRAEKQMVDMFRERHPDIEVEVQAVPWQQMDSRVIQAAAAGRAPDVAQLSTYGLPLHIPARSLQPLDGWVGKRWTKADWDDFVLPVSNTTYNGKLMGVYWNSLLCSALWYRTDLLEEKGLGVPQSWDELGKTAAALQTDRRVGYIIGLSKDGNAVGLTNWLIPAFWAAGTEVLHEDGRAAFDNEKGAMALEWLADMVYKYKATPPSIVSTTRDQMTDAFAAGTAAFTHLSSNVVATARKGQFGKFLGIAPSPGPERGKPQPALVTGKFLVMSKDCKEQEAAGLFIEHMLSPEAQLVNAKLAAEPPSRKSVLKDPWFQTPEAADMRIQLEYMADHPHPWKYHPKNNFLADLFAGGAQDMIQNRRPAREVLSQIAKRWNAEIEL